MKDIGPTPLQPEQSASDRAVAHLLRCVQNNPRLAYHLFMTETLALAIKAQAEINGEDVAEFKARYEASIQTEAPRCTDCGCKP
ncbi:hypothetical protein HBA54_27305 [Pelagibius litoralis]|uniref:Uncharacterized protein n=1 Tax=Pelagibius litoralis TaxID=374515 RepID=A0A967F323_9PROT|nr:hypothetical protein [Pelagibius litoralis]NIA72303.1 hypothetical protein [Pelagibius litoralis]